MHCVGLLSHQNALCKGYSTQQKLCVEKNNALWGDLNQTNISTN